MDIKTILAQFTTEELQKLAAAQNSQELAQIAAKFGHPIGGEEEALFAALYPMRGKKPIDEEDLDSITGGLRKPTPVRCSPRLRRTHTSSDSYDTHF